MEDIIRVNSLTKDYGKGRGLFDIDLKVKPGEVFGLVGINGSGKTTMIRHLMGFLHPDKGRAEIMNVDCIKHADILKKHIGYVPGEISFPDVKNGMAFLKLQADYLGLKNMGYAEQLIEKLSLDANANLKRMSKGMKQKTAIVSAFMADPDILLLDEPTTGLDPLMQKSFTDIIKEEKKRAKTIFMSSHMFSEMEDTCDRVAFLKDGRIISIIDMSLIRGNENVKEYKIEFNTQADYTRFLSCGFNVTRRQDEFNQATIHIADVDVNALFDLLSKLEVRFISHTPYTLENCFKDIYNKTEAA